MKFLNSQMYERSHSGQDLTLIHYIKNNLHFYKYLLVQTQLLLAPGKKTVLNFEACG